MPRDSSLVKRNAFVLPGGLLAFWSMLGTIVLLVLQPQDSRCPAVNQAVLDGVCYNVLRWLVLFIFVGVALFAFGLARYRQRPDRLYGYLVPGTGTHFALALLASLFVFPLVASLVQWLRGRSSGRFAQVMITGTEYAQHTVLLIIALVGLLIFVPFLAFYIYQGRLRRAFMQHAMEEEPAPAPPKPEGSWPVADEEPWAGVERPIPVEYPNAGGQATRADAAELGGDEVDPWAEVEAEQSGAVEGPDEVPAADTAAVPAVERAEESDAQWEPAQSWAPGADNDTVAASDENLGGDPWSSSEPDWQPAEDAEDTDPAWQPASYEEDAWEQGQAASKEEDAWEQGQAAPATEESGESWQPIEDNEWQKDTDTWKIPDEEPEPWPQTRWDQPQGAGEEVFEWNDEPLVPGEAVTDVDNSAERLEMERVVDQILREHPELESASFEGSGRCVAQSEDGSCAAVVAPGHHYCDEHECITIQENGIRCHKPRLGRTKNCILHSCRGMTKAGTHCRNPVVGDSEYCRVHAEN